MKIHAKLYCQVIEGLQSVGTSNNFTVHVVPVKLMLNIR